MMGAPATSTPFLVGIDIGGTKTHLRAEPIDGRGAARELTRPSVGWRSRDWHTDAEALLGMATKLVEGAPIAALGVGAHGCDDLAECLAFQAALQARTPLPLAVLNDAELMPLALGMRGQIGLVAGTGSIAVCRPRPGQMLVAGGWGWIVGDEGSAPGLVREAVRAVAAHFDAGGTRGEPLAEAIFDAMQVPSIPRLGSALTRAGGASEVGRFAGVVFEAAALGSQLALQVIHEGGAALARLALLLQRRGAGATDAVAGGSVIVRQPLLWSAFEATLGQLTGGSVVPRLFSAQPAIGACRLAAGLLSPDARTPSGGEEPFTPSARQRTQEPQ